MRKLYILILLVIIAGCSSADKTIKENNDLQQENTSKSNINEDAAQQHFIDGSVNEMKGSYAEAILDYQQALKYDSSAGIHFAIAKNFVRLNKLMPAMEHARIAVKKDSTNPEYKYLIATIYGAANQIDSAAMVYENIIKHDSTETQAYFNLANIYQTTKPLQARELYTKLLEQIGPDWNVLVSLAQVNEILGDIDKTIETVEELVKIDPTNLKLRKLLIESYIKNGQFEDAINLTDNLLVEYPDDLNLMEYRANALVQSGAWEEGAAEYKKLIENDDVPFESKIQIGAAFLLHSEVDSSSLHKAKDIFENIQQDTTTWQVELYLGEIALQENKDSSAVEHFKSAADMAPWNPQIFMRLGGLLFDSGRYEEVKEELSPVIDKFPDEFALNLILGLAYAQTLDNTNAEKYLKKALMLNPDDFTALYAYGVTLSLLDKKEEALIYLGKAIELDPQNSQILGTMGLIYDNLGRYEESRETYEKALAIDESDALVLNNYAYALAEQDIELERAFEMSKQALEQDPENSSYLDTFGWIHYKLGNYEEAKANIEKSLESDGENPEVLDHLGDVYLKLNDKEKAQEYWQKAYELDPEREGLKQKIEKGEK